MTSFPQIRPIQSKGATVTSDEFNRFQQGLLALLNPFLAKRVLGATFVQVGAATVAGTVFKASTGPFSSVLLLLFNGAALDPSGWTASPTAGTVTVSASLPVTAAQLAALVQT